MNGDRDIPLSRPANDRMARSRVAVVDSAWLRTSASPPLLSLANFLVVTSTLGSSQAVVLRVPSTNLAWSGNTY
jgi:hypothetical protein